MQPFSVNNEKCRALLKHLFLFIVACVHHVAQGSATFC